MPLSDSYLEFLHDQLSFWPEITIRKMFGGAGVYRDGVMFGLVADDTLYFRTGETNRAAYEEHGFKPFKPWPDKPMVMPYHRVPEHILEDHETLPSWAEQALAVARQAKKT